MTRLHRVHAFCDWLDTIPPDPPYFEHEGFRFFADLTDGEMLAARQELVRRANAARAEADALEAAARRPSNDDQPEPPEAA